MQKLPRHLLGENKTGHCNECLMVSKSHLFSLHVSLIYEIIQTALSMPIWKTCFAPVYDKPSGVWGGCSNKSPSHSSRIGLQIWALHHRHPNENLAGNLRIQSRAHSFYLKIKLVFEESDRRH